MPGFGEQMRQISLRFVPTAILSRQVGVVRGRTLILNLPGQPKSIRETLEGLRDADGKVVVPGIFAAVPYCLDLIGGPYVETHEAVCKAFRPKSALRPPRDRAVDAARGRRVRRRRPRSARWRSSRASPIRDGVDTTTLLALRFAIAAVFLVRPS
jgi:hypothetical protein